jgi:hypothetical protein
MNKSSTSCDDDEDDDDDDALNDATNANEDDHPNYSYRYSQPDDLLTRTRRSLAAGTEVARQQVQMMERERRRSMRQQRKSGSFSRRFGDDDDDEVLEEEEKGRTDTTLQLAEELLSKGHDQDYEAVFKSRPKIKMSPVATPVMREFWD